MPDSMDDCRYDEMKLMTGDRACIRKGNAVGCCHFSEHRGVITRTILKNRRCDSKKCRYFEKYEDHPYWTAVKEMQEAKERKRARQREIRDAEKKQHEQWLTDAQDIADGMGFCMKILQVKKVPRKRKYIVYYVSENSADDWYLFLDLAKAFGKTMRGNVELKHIRDMNGNYATIG